ncbi:MAG: hypothetical protein PHV37_01295 [Candidatus Gastranaerophilales bacterium]|nr:hypothetical protein [Candidatus Gastranaerophilales bacterium]
MQVNRLAQFITNITPVSSSRAKKLVKEANSVICAPAWKKIPDEMKESFVKINDKTGKAFVKGAYKELVGLMDMGGYAPKKIKIEKMSGLKMGSHSFLSNKIKLSERCLISEPKSQQIRTIGHELTHCAQYNEMVASTRYGVEEVASMLAEQKVQRLVPPPKTQRMAQAKYEEFREIFELKLKRAYKKAIENPIKPESKKDIRNLDRYYDAIIENPTHFNPHSKDTAEGFQAYLDNFLEVEARSIGEAVENYYNVFTKYFSEFMR